MKKEKIKSDDFFSSKYGSVSLLLSLLLFLLLFYIALILVASFYHNRNVYTTAAALAIWSYIVQCIHSVTRPKSCGITSMCRITFVSYLFNDRFANTAPYK